MHPDDAEAMVETAKRDARYHLQIAVERLTSPTVDEYHGGQEAAELAGRVVRVFRCAGSDLREGAAIVARIEPFVPRGGCPPITPCVHEEQLAGAKFAELYLDDDLVAREGTARALSAPTDAGTF